MKARWNRWLRRLLRTSGLGARTLQIREILEAAEEHLQAASLPGLKTRFLPTRLSIAVAGADLKGLRPFAANLEEDLRAVLGRLARRPGFQALSERLEVQLVEAGELRPGSAPRFQAGFPAGGRRAFWRPEDLRPDAADTPVAQASPEPQAPLVEMVLTATATDRTALQSVFLLCLAPTLAARCLVAQRPPDELLEIDADHRIRIVGSGDPWLKMEPAVSELKESLPAGLISSVEGPEDETPLALYRFLRTDQPDLLWAPRGLLLVGRKSGLVHWVPPSPPQNLSGRHLAFLRARGDALRVVDLGSTNGTFVAGRELRPFERVMLSLPNAVEIGTEGVLRIDLRQWSEPS